MIDTQSVQKLSQAYVDVIDNAKRNGLWFYKKFLFFELWLSPEEFKSYLLKGLKWCNGRWDLRNPEERISELENEIQIRQDEIISIKEEISRNI
ncbi:MAG: hypothetical protein P4L45_16415 [Ignavibacteriaceae bacterium]|nr:hypothetical protein [Ignavibacteriaceae bacterium]